MPPLRQKNIKSDDLDNEHFLFVFHNLNAQQSALKCIFPKDALKRQKYNLPRGKKYYLCEHTLLQWFELNPLRGFGKKFGLQLTENGKHINLCSRK